MQIKGIEIDFDFLDADKVEKFENEAKKVVEKSKIEPKEIAYSQALKMECEIVEDFIDNVFGKGVSKKIFKGKKNLKEHIEVFQALADEKNNAQQDLQNLYNQYLPKQEK